MENKGPLVSVVIPAYNSKNYIIQAIESVWRQQGDFAIEIFVVDDASTDGTDRLVEEWKAKHEPQSSGTGGCSCTLTYLKNPKNLGVAETRNRAIRLAKGEYLAFLDADDWWSEDKLRRQIGLLRKKHAVLCATARELMREDGSSMGKIIEIPSEITYRMLLRTNTIPCSSVVMRTNIAREFYMKNDRLHEDYILWLRVLKKYQKAYGINEPMLRSRMSEDGKSRNKLKSAKMQFGVYRYLGFGILKSCYYFVQYAVNGVKKYR